MDVNIELQCFVKIPKKNRVGGGVRWGVTTVGGGVLMDVNEELKLL